MSFLKGSATVAEWRLHADGPALPGARDCPLVHPAGLPTGGGATPKGVVEQACSW
jgi:hypothetical protein